MPDSARTDSFAPKLLTLFQGGYSLERLRKDATAGLTVAIVALPLSMGIAIASGASPERGLYAAIVGGFIISALGGSMHQIGGPAGAFIVLVAATIERHGLDGFFLATMMAGAMMVMMGALRLGALIRFIPPPVIAGFTAGIAVIIFASQLRDIFGLSLTGKEPAAFLPKIEALAGAISTVNPYAVAIALLAAALIQGIQRINRALPSLLIAVVAAALAVWLFNLPVETIGSRFGGVPSGLPAPALPPYSWEKAVEVFPAAATIALLGGIESLLSAVVADGMSGRRHRSNTELIAQGVANIACPLFGGICATGTIARTATNVRAGATSPVAGMLHALFVLAAVLFAAPLMKGIPLAALAAMLAIVAWNMADRREIAHLLKAGPAEAAALIVTILVTVFAGLLEGIVGGVAILIAAWAFSRAR
jgi:SulP family sulfate permease